MTVTAADAAGSGNIAVIVAVIMGVTSTVGVAIAGWFTYRSARRNTDSTRQVEEQKQVIANWEMWRNDVLTLRKQREEDRQEYEDHRNDCATRVAEQAREVAALRSQIAATRVWEERIVRIMEEHGIAFPPPPLAAPLESASPAGG